MLCRVQGNGKREKKRKKGERKSVNQKREKKEKK
jgi:hypothetical protein